MITEHRHEHALHGIFNWQTSVFIHVYPCFITVVDSGQSLQRLAS